MYIIDIYVYALDWFFVLLHLNIAFQRGF